MVRRACFLPGVILSFISAGLLVLSTVSLPLAWGNSTPFSVWTATNLDPAVLDFTPGANNARQVIGLRGGTWGYCSTGLGESGSYAFCNNLGSAYSMVLRPATNTTNVAYPETRLEKSWTRGIVVVVVAFVFAMLALITSVVPNLLVLLISSFLNLITAILSLIAFIIALVLYLYARNRIHRISPGADVMPGVQFYLTLISIPISVGAGITVCCGRREKDDSVGDVESEGVSNKRIGGGLFGRRRNKNASAAYSAGGEESAAEIPMDSRQKVLSAFNESKE